MAFEEHVGITPSASNHSLATSAETPLRPDLERERRSVESFQLEVEQLRRELSNTVLESLRSEVEANMLEVSLRSAGVLPEKVSSAQHEHERAVAAAKRELSRESTALGKAAAEEAILADVTFDSLICSSKSVELSFRESSTALSRQADEELRELLEAVNAAGKATEAAFQTCAEFSTSRLLVPLRAD